MDRETTEMNQLPLYKGTYTLDCGCVVNISHYCQYQFDLIQSERAETERLLIRSRQILEQLRVNREHLDTQSEVDEL